MNKLKKAFCLILLFTIETATAQSFTYLRPERVFDGEKILEKYGVLIKDNKIENIDNQVSMEKVLPKDTKIIDLKGSTLLPGLIEGHTHLFLHPYNETPWED